MWMQHCCKKIHIYNKTSFLSMMALPYVLLLYNQKRQFAVKHACLGRVTNKKDVLYIDWTCYTPSRVQYCPLLILSICLLVAELLFLLTHQPAQVVDQAWFTSLSLTWQSWFSDPCLQGVRFCGMSMLLSCMNIARVRCLLKYIFLLENKSIRKDTVNKRVNCTTHHDKQENKLQ